MDYTLALTRHATEALNAHLLGDRSREQMAITLCGVNRLHRETRLLVRDVVLLPPDAYRRQSSTGLELKPEVQAFVHQRAHEQGLIQVDWHSHPGRGNLLAFSATDDHHEATQAAYLAHRMGNIPYGSVVVNDDALDARLWTTRSRRRKGKDGTVRTITYRPQPQPMQAILTGDLQRRIPLGAGRTSNNHDAALPATHDRQVRAFGQAFQRKLAGLRVGLVGLGGLGSALADQLARLGVRDWVLVDPDVVELTNLNRLVHATLTDAQKARPKVYVARSSIRQSNPKAVVRALQTDLFDAGALRALKACDLLIAATDNHASRMALNRLSAQYLIPLLHTGFHIGVETGSGKREPQVTDVSGEYALPDLGRWCLQCAGIVDPQQAGWELAPPAQQAVIRQRGYIDGTPAPAVRHLDGTIASLATTEVHNLVHPFKAPGGHRSHRYLAYDALRTELVPLQVTPSDGCPVCSPDDGVLGLGDLEPLPDYRRHVDQALLLPPPESIPQPLFSPAEDRTSTARTEPPAQEVATLQMSTPLSPAAPSPHSALDGPPLDRRARARRQLVTDDSDQPWP